MLAILADIGGTNTRVALAEGTSVRPDSVARFSNAEYKARGQDIAHILRDYLDRTGAKVDGVCVAAAGPVQDGVATMTNLDWVMDAAKLSAATGEGLKELEAQLGALLMGGNPVSPDQGLITRVHQRDSLRRAAEALERLLQNYTASPEFLSIDPKTTCIDFSFRRDIFRFH